MNRPPNRLAPPCSRPYQRHAWPATQRRATPRSGEVRRCIHVDCTVSQVARDAPPRAHSTLLWYWSRP